MRRGSVFAPLLLIGLGLLFLVRNLYPDLPVMDFLSRYWPFVLILWGGLRLAEILYWAATSKPLPPHGVSGGEWILVVFLCLAGWTVSAIHNYNGWWPRNSIRLGGLDMFGETFDYPLSGQTASGKAPHIVIESFRGSARITGADTDQVKATGRKTVRAMQQGDADKADKQTPFELISNGEQLIVRTNQDRVNGGYRISEDLELTVPKDASVEARGRYGDFDVTGVNGSVEVNSDNSGVRLQDIGGDVRLDLRRSDVIHAANVKGGVDLRGRGSDIELQNVQGNVSVNGTYTGVVQFRGLAKPLHFEGPQTELHVEKLPGQIRMALGDFTGINLVGPVRLTSRSRDVTISGVTQSLEISVDRGDIDLRPERAPLARMDVHTRSGDIELALPVDAKFDLKASTKHGDVSNDYGAPLKTQPEGRGADLGGSVGDGPTLTLNSDRGSITVRKASANDKPITFPDEKALPSLPMLPKPPHMPPIAPKPQEN